MNKSERDKEYYQQNKYRLNEAAKERLKHKRLYESRTEWEERKRKQKEYYQKNKEVIKAKQKEYRRKKKEEEKKEIERVQKLMKLMN